MRSTKRSFALLLALALLASVLAACGSKTMSEDEYKEAFEKLGEDIQTVQDDVGAIDPSDTDAAKKALEDLKAPFEEFIKLSPPDSFKEAHAKISSGCQAMVDFVETSADMIGEEDQAKIQEASTALMQSLQTAISDLAEGESMLE